MRAMRIGQSGISPSLQGGVEPSVVELFRRQALASPKRLAVVGRREQWTYGALDQLSERIAYGLVAEAGEAVGIGMPVAVLMEHDAWLIAAILGILRAGRAYVALDSAHPPARLQSLLKLVGAGVVVTDDANASMARNLFGGARIAEVEELARSRGDRVSVSLPAVTSETLACIALTSGSTGSPKGVALDHKGLIHRGGGFCAGAPGGVGSDDRVAMVTQAGLGAAPSSIYGTLLHGACLMPFCLGAMGIERLAKWMRDRQITMMQTVPTVWRRLAEMSG